MTFARLRAADWIALAAALALLLVTAMAWYGTTVGDEAQRVENALQSRGGPADDAQRAVRDDARLSAERQRRNAWQADAAVDRLVLLALLTTVVLAVSAAFLRASGRRFEPPWTPSAVTLVFAAIAALLVLYRVVQEPGVDEFTTVKAGAPLAIAGLGIVAVAAAAGVQHEQDGREFRSPRAVGGAP